MHTGEERHNRQLTQRWLELLEGSLEVGATVELPVLSNSMLPAFGIGRKIKIRRVHWKYCSTSDIIVFREGRKLTAHRLLFALRMGRKCYFYQKGDSSPCGHFIRSDRVVGRVVEYQDGKGNYRSVSSATVSNTPRIRVFLCVLSSLWEQTRRLVGRMFD